MAHDDSQRTLRASADNSSKRAGSIAMAILRAYSVSVDFSGPRLAKNLKFSRHTRQYWDKFPQSDLKPRVHPNASPRRHRPQDPRPAAVRQPNDHAGTGRQGRPVGVALPPP